MSSSDSAGKRDMLLVGGPVEDGDGLRVLRAREDRLEIGELRAPKEGAPIEGDLVRLKQRTEHERLFDVEVLLSSNEGAPSMRAGPARVSSDRYRENWETLFGKGSKQQLPS